MLYKKMDKLFLLHFFHVVQAGINWGTGKLSGGVFAVFDVHEFKAETRC